MSSSPRTTEAALEALSDAHDAYLRTGDFMTCADPRGHIHAYNRLLDAAIATGFDRRSVERVSDWSAARLAAWRLSAPIADRDDLTELGCALAAFRRAGSWPAATTRAGSTAYARLHAAAGALGYDASCQLSVDDWAGDRLRGMYVREAA